MVRANDICDVIEVNAERVDADRICGRWHKRCPVIARADVGIAMGGMGREAAIEVADVVIATDEPSKLVEGIEVARKTRRIVWQNVIFSISVKAVFLGLGFMGMATMWEAIFADVGVAILAIFNSLRAMFRT